MRKLTAAPEAFEHFRLKMSSEDFCLFCFLLDSVEGLATHSSPVEQDTLDLSVAPSQKADCLSFLQIWADYKIHTISTNI